MQGKKSRINHSKRFSSKEVPIKYKQLQVSKQPSIYSASFKNPKNNDSMINLQDNESICRKIKDSVGSPISWTHQSSSVCNDQKFKQVRQRSISNCIEPLNNYDKSRYEREQALSNIDQRSNRGLMRQQYRFDNYYQQKYIKFQQGDQQFYICQQKPRHYRMYQNQFQQVNDPHQFEIRSVSDQRSKHQGLELKRGNTTKDQLDSDSLDNQSDQSSSSLLYSSKREQMIPTYQSKRSKSDEHHFQKENPQNSKDQNINYNYIQNQQQIIRSHQNPIFLNQIRNNIMSFKLQKHESPIKQYDNKSVLLNNDNGYFNQQSNQTVYNEKQIVNEKYKGYVKQNQRYLEVLEGKQERNDNTYFPENNHQQITYLLEQIHLLINQNISINESSQSSSKEQLVNNLKEHVANKINVEYQFHVAISFVVIVMNCFNLVYVLEVVQRGEYVSGGVGFRQSLIIQISSLIIQIFLLLLLNVWQNQLITLIINKYTQWIDNKFKSKDDDETNNKMIELELKQLLNKNQWYLNLRLFIWQMSVGNNVFALSDNTPINTSQLFLLTFIFLTIHFPTNIQQLITISMITTFNLYSHFQSISNHQLKYQDIISYVNVAISLILILVSCVNKLKLNKFKSNYHVTYQRQLLESMKQINNISEPKPQKIVTKLKYKHPKKSSSQLKSIFEKRLEDKIKIQDQNDQIKNLNQDDQNDNFQKEIEDDLRSLNLRNYLNELVNDDQESLDNDKNRNDQSVNTKQQQPTTSNLSQVSIKQNYQYDLNKTQQSLSSGDNFIQDCQSKERVDNDLSQPQLNFKSANMNQQNNEVCKIISQKIGILDFLYNNLNQGSMLFSIKSKGSNQNQNDECIINNKINLEKQPKQNKQYFKFSKNTAKSLINPKEPYKNKFELDIISISNDFFNKIPFYERLQYHYNLELKKKNANNDNDKPDDNKQKKKSSSNILGNNHSNIPQNYSILDEFSFQMFSSNNSNILTSLLKYSMKNNQLAGFDKYILEQKIYQPYFISNSTIIHFQKQQENQSLIDILDNHIQSNNQVSRFYFKVNLNDDIEYVLKMQSKIVKAQKEKRQSSKCKSVVLQTSRSENIYSSQKVSGRGSFGSGGKQQRQESYSSSNRMNPINRQNVRREPEQEENSFEVEAPMSQLMQDYQEDKCISKDPEQSNIQLRSMLSQLNDQQNEYIDQSLNINQSINSVSPAPAQNDQMTQFYSKQVQQNQSKQLDDEILYFEIEFRNIDNKIENIKKCKNIYLLNIKDVTQLIKKQQKLSDMIYQEAIEKNYAHEYMTPLNCIQNFAEFLRDRIVKLYLQQLNGGSASGSGNSIKSSHSNFQVLPQILQRSQQAKETIKYITGIQQNTGMIFYYNTNQLTRMKIHKDQLELNETVIQLKDINDVILHVMWTFEFLIQRRKMNVYIIKTNSFQCWIKADWFMYELILFNIIQNAVKYVKWSDDNIFIILTCKPLQSKNKNINGSQGLFKDYMLETQIIDTGIGIESQRQNLLFIPFLELKHLQGIQRTENDSIGLGLACSQTITKILKGDIKLEESQKGLTCFAFKILIQVSFIDPVKQQKQSQSCKQLYSQSLIDQHQNKNNNLMINTILAQQQQQLQNQPKNEIEIELQMGKERILSQQIIEYLQRNEMNEVLDKLREQINNPPNNNQEIPDIDQQQQQNQDGLNSCLSLDIYMRKNNPKANIGINQQINKYQQKQAQTRFSGSIQYIDQINQWNNKIMNQNLNNNFIRQTQSNNENYSHFKNLLDQDQNQLQSGGKEHLILCPNQKVNNSQQNKSSICQSNDKFSNKNDLQLSNMSKSNHSSGELLKMKKGSSHQIQNQIIQPLTLDEINEENQSLGEQSQSNQINMLSNSNESVEQIRPIWQRNLDKNNNNNQKGNDENEQKSIKNQLNALHSLQFSSQQQQNNQDRELLIQNPQNAYFKIINLTQQQEQLSPLSGLKLNLQNSGDSQQVQSPIISNNQEQINQQVQEQQVSQQNSSVQVSMANNYHQLQENQMLIDSIGGMNIEQINNQNKELKFKIASNLINNNNQNQIWKIIQQKINDQDNDDHQQIFYDAYNGQIQDILVNDDDISKQIELMNENRQNQIEIEKQQSSDSQENLNVSGIYIKQDLSEQANQQIVEVQNQNQALQNYHNIVARNTISQQNNEYSPFINSQNSLANFNNLSKSQNSNSVYQLEVDLPKHFSENISGNNKKSPPSNISSSGQNISIPKVNLPQLQSDIQNKHGIKGGHPSSKQQQSYTHLELLNKQKYNVKSSNNLMGGPIKRHLGLQQIQEESSKNNFDSPKLEYKQLVMEEVKMRSQYDQESQSISDIQDDVNEGVSSQGVVMRCRCQKEVLIVDDNDFNLQALGGIISHQFKLLPEEAQNGVIAVNKVKAALKKSCKCQNRAYQLIFMDINMPEMDGIEATLQINKLIQEENQKLDQDNQLKCEIFALTACRNVQTKNKCLNAGMIEFLNKPIDAETVRRVMNKYFYENELQQ